MKNLVKSFSRLVPPLVVLVILISMPVEIHGEDGILKGPDDVLDALKLLQEQKSKDKEELNRLSEMVLIPAGEFRMGYDKGSPEERPAHRIFVDAFYIDKFETTQLQYIYALGENPSYFKHCPLCPVERVTYFQAAAYCKKLNKRLPTEAEWEKAAKGGVEDIFYWNGDYPDEFAWYGNNADHKTHPVGLKKPNAYGLHDMAGNVWEWVQDWYASDYYQSSPAKNPQGPESGTTRVIRGGAWGHLPELLRHSYRESYSPDTRYIIGGFRCASDLN